MGSRVRTGTMFVCAAVLLAALVLGCTRPENSRSPADSLLVNDVSTLNATRVAGIVRAQRVATLKEAVRRARLEGLRISVAGARHSQGGHQFTEGGLLLDMTDFDDILEVDPVHRTVTVEAGATWAEVQEALHPHGLSVAVMQSSNIFTVGGSISVNAHGRDPRHGPIISTVRAFHLLTPSGEVVEVSREKNADLFGLALGGFGLFGVILDVELEVKPNVLCERRITAMDYAAYPGYFKEHIRGRTDVALESARLSIAPGLRFLRDLYSSEHVEIAGPCNQPLVGQANVGRDRLMFDLSRRWGWGKRLRWFLQTRVTERPGSKEVVSRNNAMRPAIDFLEHRSDRDADILQEYFVPIDSLVGFIDDARAIMEAHRVNMLHNAIRFVPKNTEAFLSYATEDMLAVVLYINVETTDAGVARAALWTRSLAEAALARGGTYYLAYQRFPTRDQLRRAYPRIDEFFAKKLEYDPSRRFSNKFYEEYSR